jgi:hypothetical protein
MLVIDEGVLRRRDVQVGEEWSGGLVQVEGVAAAERVVTAPLGDIEDGEAIELVEF